MDKINLLDEAAKVRELWTRVTPAGINDYDVHVNRIQGEYVWHSHSDTDDVLMCSQDGWSSSCATVTPNWDRER